MKKLLLVSILLLSACDDNSTKESSNPTNQPNNNTTSGLLSALTQRDVEFFKKNDAEREAVLKKCLEDFTNNKFSIENHPLECEHAGQARAQIEIITELKGEVSAEGFRKNDEGGGTAHLGAANYCHATDPFIPLNNPICKAIIEYARQLKAECKTRVCDSDEIFKRLQIKE